jgi:hypothetical protein
MAAPRSNVWFRKGEHHMTTFNGNQQVQSGYYFSTNTLGVEVIGEGGGRLPGAATTRYVSVPFPALFVIIPVVGLAFLIFLPLIGFELIGYALVQRLTGHVAKEATAFAATVAPPQATGAAYLGGREGEKKNEKVAPEIEKLEQEISDKRNKS